MQTVRRGYPSKKDEKQWAKVSSGKSIGLWPNPYDTCLIFRVKSADGIEETVPISLEQHTDRFLRLGNHYGGLFVSIRNCDTSVIFACYPYKPGRAPLLLVNHSTESVVNFRDADSSKLLVWFTNSLPSELQSRRLVALIGNFLQVQLLLIHIRRL